MVICENFFSFDTVVNSLLSSSRFSRLLLGLLYMQPSNNISLLFSLICAHTLSSNFTLNVNSQVLTETNVIKVMDFNGIQCFYANTKQTG
jgi:hypothetical protein